MHFKICASNALGVTNCLVMWPKWPIVALKALAHKLHKLVHVVLLESVAKSDDLRFLCLYISYGQLQTALALVTKVQTGLNFILKPIQ